MRKLIYIIITPVVTILLLVLKFPDIEERLTSVSVYAVLYLQIFLIVATIFTYYITMYSPFRKYEELAKKRWFLLEFYADKIKKNYSTYIVSLNIMAPKRRFCYFIEPSASKNKKRFSFTGRVFRVIWNNGQNVNKKLRITTNQGACGKAYSEGRLTVHNFTLNPKPVTNFTVEQENLTAEIQFVLSLPIFSTEEQVQRVKNEIVGVLNVESTMSGSQALAYNTAFLQDILEFCRICGKLLK